MQSGGKKTLPRTAAHHRQSSDWAASAPDKGCFKPSVPVWKSLIFRRTQRQRFAETFRDRSLLKRCRTAFNLFSLRGCQACKSIFPLGKRGSPGRFTDRIFHRNRTVDTALWRDQTLHSRRGWDCRRCEQHTAFHPPLHAWHERQDPCPDEQHDQQQHYQKLFTGRCDHHAWRSLLSAGQSRSKIPDSRHGTWPVLIRFHPFHWTDGGRESE